MGRRRSRWRRLPNNYKLVLDNSEVSVIRTHYAPHEKIPVHDHPALSTLFVFLNDGGAVKVERPDDPAATLTRPPQVKGEFRVAGAAAERHSVENMGDTSSDFLRIELKQVPLAMKEPFIGKAPASTGATVDALEFTDVGLMVERILCVGPAVCPVKLTTFPSLIVALSPLTLTEGGEKGEKMPAGGVHWLNAAQGGLRRGLRTRRERLTCCVWCFLPCRRSDGLGSLTPRWDGYGGWQRIESFHVCFAE